MIINIVHFSEVVKLYVNPLFVHFRFLHSFEDFYRKLGCTMVNHPRGNRSRHRSGRSLIRDRDRATPINSLKDKVRRKGISVIILLIKYLKIVYPTGSLDCILLRTTLFIKIYVHIHNKYLLQFSSFFLH